MLRSPLLSNTHATRGACDAFVRSYGNGALSTCSMVKGSAKHQTGKRTGTTTTQRSEIFTAARLYSPSARRRIDSGATQTPCARPLVHRLQSRVAQTRHAIAFPVLCTFSGGRRATGTD